MAAEKQLIVAVEGTAAIGPFWGPIVSDYLERIVRCFGGNELNGQKPSAGNVEFALVVFNAHGSSSACLVQRSGWTKDVDVFLWWLSALTFTGGGFCEAAIAEGLGEALMMFSLSSNANQNVDGHKHCILITASNPYPLPTPVYRPKIAISEQNEKTEVSTESCLYDAEMVAKFFSQCPVSLSVISPKQLPKLRAIYNASKRNPQASDPPVDNLKNPQFLVLISENFMEARSALSRSGIAVLGPNQVPVKVDTSSVPPVSGPPATSIPSVNGSMVNRQSVPGVNIPTATVKVEPTTVTSMGAAAYPHLPSVSHGKPQGAPTLQTSSPSSTSQDVITNGDNAQEFKPMVNGTSQPLRPVGPAAANVSILNNLSQARQVMSSASLTGATSMGLQTMGGNPMAMHMSNMISSGMSASALPAAPNVYSSGQSGMTSVTGSAALVGNAQVAQNAPHGSFSSATSNMTGNSNLSTSQPLASLQGSASMGQSVPVMSQGNHSVTQMGQNGIGMNQNMMNGLGASNVTAGGGTMIPTPGMSQQVQSGSLPQGSQQAKYLKVWEGALSGQRQGQPVFITKLEGYRNASASDTLAADWPPMMQIVRLISQDHMNNKQYVGKADFLVFRALNQHGFLAQLQEKKLCAVIQLPSQTLLLSVSDKASRLIGMLFPGDMVVFKPQIPNQSQQLQQQQQQHPQLQQQQQQQQHPQLQQQQQHPQLQQQQHPQMQQQQQQQQQQSLQQLQPQHPQLQQQQLQQLQPQQLQQQPQQHHQQQMVGTGMGQAYMQGAGRSQLMPQGTMSAQGPSSMPGGGFLT